MRRFSTILLYVTIAFLLLWQLPWCYNFFVVKPEKTPLPYIVSSLAISHRWDRKRKGKRASRLGRKHLFGSCFRQHPAYVLLPPVDV